MANQRSSLSMVFVFVLMGVGSLRADSVQNHYAGQPVQAFRGIKEELESVIEGPQVELKILMAEDIFAEHPQQIPLSELVGLYKQAQKKNQHQFVRTMLKKRLENLSILEKEESFSLSDMRKQVDEAFSMPETIWEYPHEKRARLRFLAVAISRKLAQNPSLAQREAKWLFLLGKAQHGFSKGGHEALKRYLDLESDAGAQAYKKQARQMLSGETYWTEPQKHH